MTYNKDVVSRDQLNDILSCFNKLLSAMCLMESKQEEVPRGKAKKLSTENEKQVAEIWESILKCNTLLADDNFFALGGTSLNAVEFITRMSQIKKKYIPLRVIMQNPILKDLALKIDDIYSKDQPTATLLHYNQASTKPAIIWCGVGCQHYILQRFGATHTIYVIENYYDIPAKEKHLSFSIKDLVHEFLNDFKPLKNDFIIAGYSAGGTLAYELSKELSMSYKVKGLFLLDPPPDKVMIDNAPVKGLARRKKSEHILGFLRNPGKSDFLPLLYSHGKTKVKSLSWFR